MNEPLDAKKNVKKKSRHNRMRDKFEELQKSNINRPISQINKTRDLSLPRTNS